MVAVSLLPVASGAAGALYLWSALALGAVFLGLAAHAGARAGPAVGAGDVPLLAALPRADLRRPRDRRRLDRMAPRPGTAEAGRGPSFFLSPLGIVFTTVVIDLVGFGIVLPILPLWAEDFGASPTQIGLLTASYAVVQLLFAPVWGRLSDRYGRRPVILASLAGERGVRAAHRARGDPRAPVRRADPPGDRGRVLRRRPGLRGRRDQPPRPGAGDGADRRGLRPGVHPRARVRRGLLGGRRPPALLRGGGPGGAQPGHRLPPPARVAAPRRPARAGAPPGSRAPGAREPRAGAARVALVHRDLRLRRHGVHVRAVLASGASTTAPSRSRGCSSSSG